MAGERPTAAEIDLDALAANYAEARRLAGGREVVAVVKADAYGHGAEPVARRLVAEGCRRLAVATVAEAAALAEAGVDATLVVMGGVHDREEAARAAALGAVPVVQHEEQVALLAKAAAARRDELLPVELEVDTGMRRMGVPADEALSVAARLASTPGLALVGLYSHLACADEPELSSARAQLERFGEWLEAARRRGLLPGRIHLENSAGLLQAEALADLLPPPVTAARPGLMLYGVAPARFLRARATLRPVMRLVTRVANRRRVRAGDPVGYGATWRAPAAGVVATLPVGYADGVPWTLGSRAVVLHRGRRVPLVGRVSMDLVTVWVGDGPVEIGDEVVCFGAAPGGAEPGKGVLAEEWAEAAGTIPYEVLTGVGPRVPRRVRA